MTLLNDLLQAIEDDALGQPATDTQGGPSGRSSNPPSQTAAIFGFIAIGVLDGLARNMGLGLSPSVDYGNSFWIGRHRRVCAAAVFLRLPDA
jgi:hypothetical protein